MRGAIEKIKEICTRKADPPIPFVFHSGKTHHMVHVDNIHEHKKLTILALLLDRNDSFIDEAKQLLEENAAEPMDISFDVIEIHNKIESILKTEHGDCQVCAQNWDQDTRITDEYDTVLSSFDESLAFANRFRDALKGRYHLDFTHLFPNIAENNHTVCIGAIMDLCKSQLDPVGEEYVFIMEPFVDGTPTLHCCAPKTLVDKVNAFCKEECTSI